MDDRICALYARREPPLAPSRALATRQFSVDRDTGGACFLQGAARYSAITSRNTSIAVEAFG